jgi:hypothetical protein
MTTVQYYRISWLFPIVVPLAALALEFLLNHFGARLPDAVSSGIGIIFNAVFIFLIPYAVLVCILLLSLRNQSEKEYVIALSLSPLLMAVLVSVFLLVAGSSSHPVISMSLFYARYCLSIGYFYVSLILMSLWFLRRLGVVSD